MPFDRAKKEPHECGPRVEQRRLLLAVSRCELAMTGQLRLVLLPVGRQRTQALYEVARQLAGTLTLAQLVDIVRQFVDQQLHAES